MDSTSLRDTDKRISFYVWMIFTAGLVAALVVVIRHRADALCAGVSVILIGVSACAGYTVGCRRQDRESTRRRLNALSSLTGVSSILWDQPATIDAAIERMLQDVPLLLGLPVALLQTPDDDERNMVVANAVGLPHLIGRLDPIEVSRDCERSGAPSEVITIEDIDRCDSPLATRHVQSAGVRAAMILPLAVDSEILGVLTLGDFQPRTFTPDQLELGRLWGTQISLILANQQSWRRLSKIITSDQASAEENALLHAQALRDADTKATLLRELHHRVKNNLAAIVGLLSTNVPAMSPTAQRWLDRLTERISSMAQAQELFNRSTTKVPLVEIVRRVVASISSVAPSGVTIVKDLGEVPVILEADRAVALTMALHELCHNALTYGVGEHGTLTLGARTIHAGRIRIEVIDDGSAASPFMSDNGNKIDSPSAGPVVGQLSPMGIGRARVGGKGGLGIHVVRGLVARELRGEFALVSPSQGGTVATIEFPIASEVRG